MPSIPMTSWAENDRIVDGVRAAISLLVNVMNFGVTPRMRLTHAAVAGGAYERLFAHTFREWHGENCNTGPAARAWTERPRLADRQARACTAGYIVCATPRGQSVARPHCARAPSADAPYCAGLRRSAGAPHVVELCFPQNSKTLLPQKPKAVLLARSTAPIEKLCFCERYVRARLTT